MAKGEGEEGWRGGGWSQIPRKAPRGLDTCSRLPVTSPEGRRNRQQQPRHGWDMGGSGRAGRVRGGRQRQAEAGRQASDIRGEMHSSDIRGEKQATHRRDKRQANDVMGDREAAIQYEV